MTFDAKHKKSSQAIRSLRRRGDPYGTRTHVTAVKGRCLNHLTNGPYKRRRQKAAPFLVAAPGFEPGTLRV